MYVRRVVVMGLGPIGCAPRYLWQYSSEDGSCIDEINNVVMEFNFIMRRMVQELNQQLPDIKIIFCDVLEGSLEIIKNHQQYGEHYNTHYHFLRIHLTVCCSFRVRCG